MIFSYPSPLPVFPVKGRSALTLPTSPPPPPHNFRFDPFSRRRVHKRTCGVVRLSFLVGSSLFFPPLSLSRSPYFLIPFDFLLVCAVHSPSLRCCVPSRCDLFYYITTAGLVALVAVLIAPVAPRAQQGVSCHDCVASTKSRRSNHAPFPGRALDDAPPPPPPLLMCEAVATPQPLPFGFLPLLSCRCHTSQNESPK